MEQNANIAILSRNAEQLVLAYKQLKAENEVLKAENARIQAELGLGLKKLEELENKNINLQLSKSLEHVGVSSNTLFKDKLDEFIKELDECIANLKTGISK